MRTSRSSNFLSRAAALRFLSDRALRRARLCASRTTAVHPPRLPCPSSGLDRTNISNSLSMPRENGLVSALTPSGADSVACATGATVAVARAIVAAAVPPTDPNGARTAAMLFGGGGMAATTSSCSRKTHGCGESPYHRNEALVSHASICPGAPGQEKFYMHTFILVKMYEHSDLAWRKLGGVWRVSVRCCCRFSCGGTAWTTCSSPRQSHGLMKYRSPPRGRYRPEQRCSSRRPQKPPPPASELGDWFEGVQKFDLNRTRQKRAQGVATLPPAEAARPRAAAHRCLVAL